MAQNYEKIWFLTDENMQVLTKWTVMESVHDKGRLQSNAGKLKFQGKKHHLAISDVQALSLFQLKPQKIMQKLILVL